MKDRCNRNIKIKKKNKIYDLNLWMQERVFKELLELEIKKKKKRLLNFLGSKAKGKSLTI